MSRHTVTVDIDADEILSELSDEEVLAEAESRLQQNGQSRVPLIRDLFMAIGRNDLDTARGIVPRLFLIPSEAWAADAAIREHF